MSDHCGATPPLRVLHWHAHAAWSTAFVQGPHHYLLPTLPGGGRWGGGRPEGRAWPTSTRDVPARELADTPVDVVVLQHPREIALTELWTGRRPGRDLPAVYVEHNTPRDVVPDTRHPVADRDDIVLVHVTHFNALMWDSGQAPTVVIEHGVPDPGHRYTGELDRAAVVVNEPVRRGRVVGTDLLPRLAAAAPLDVFGIGVERLTPGGADVRPVGDLHPEALHAEMARRRAYLHPVRWTSLGLSLIEAMLLGLPVAALATTEVARAVPPDAGVVSADVDDLAAALRAWRADPALAAATGARARAAARERHGLGPFLARWDALLAEAARAAGGVAA